MHRIGGTLNETLLVFRRVSLSSALEHERHAGNAHILLYVESCARLAGTQVPLRPGPFALREFHCAAAKLEALISHGPSETAKTGPAAAIH